MAFVIVTVQLIAIVACIAYQFYKGFTDIRPDVYFNSILLIDLSGFLLLVIIAMFLHSIISNKYLAFFAFVVFLLLNSFLWSMLEVESNMVQYGSKPSYTYSDMNGYGPFITGIIWFRSYWGLFAMMIALISISAWTRGKESGIKTKLAFIANGAKGRSGKLLAVFGLLWVICAGFVYYNTQIVNAYDTSDETEKLQVEYEKQFKKYEGINQPRGTDFKYTIDLFPESRRVTIKGVYWAKNKGVTPIDSIHFTIAQDFETTIDIAGARKIADH